MGVVIMRQRKWEGGRERGYTKDKEVDGLWPQKVENKPAMTRR